MGKQVGGGADGRGCGLFLYKAAFDSTADRSQAEARDASIDQQKIGAVLERSETEGIEETLNRALQEVGEAAAGVLAEALPPRIFSVTFLPTRSFVGLTPSSE